MTSVLNFCVYCVAVAHVSSPSFLIIHFLFHNFLCRSIQEGDPRRIASINILDSAGFSDPVGANSGSGALFEDFCHNYQSERLQKFFHSMMFTQQLDRYSQENVDCTFDSVSGSPEKVVTVIDKAGQVRIFRSM
jgi:myosin heavy subunit